MKGFHFPSTRTTNSVRLLLGSQYSFCQNYIKGARLWRPESTKFDTQTMGMPVACYQSALISETSFFSQWYFPWSGRNTNGILWEIVASSLFLCPHGFAARSCVLARLASLAQNKTACSQAIRRQV